MKKSIFIFTALLILTSSSFAQSKFALGVAYCDSGQFAESIFLFTDSSVSPKYWRRSEWPMITWLHPADTIISAEISPV